MSIWHDVPTLESLNAAGENTLIHHLDIKFTAIGTDYLAATMPVDARTHQPFGLLHGGASVVLAETIGSVAANRCIDATKYLCVGQEINANHLRAIRSGLVTGTTRPVHLGGRTQVWAIDIVNDAGERVCVSRLTVAVVRAGTFGSSNPL